MLKSIKIKNFRSIGTEQVFSLEINSKDVLDESACEYKTGVFLNNVACVIGSNASGKTNVLNALDFLSWFIENSYSSLKLEQSIGLSQHKLHQTENTVFEIEFYENEALYCYFIELNSKQVLKERLDKKSYKEKSRLSNVFKLTRKPEKPTEPEIKNSINKKINENDLSRIKDRANISLLSALIDLGYLPEIKFFKKIETNLENRYPFARKRDSFSISQRLYQDEKLRNHLLAFSSEIDLGISDFDFFILPKQRPALSEAPLLLDDSEKVLMCKHTSDKGSFDLFIFQESNGTQLGYAILSDIFPILEKGGLIVLDEIEDGLHPHVLKKIISLFESKETNPNNAQIIFSTHQHGLLLDRTKTQIFITEKDSNLLETEIYRLDDVEGVRNDENFLNKYLAGIYGGTPNIKWI